MDNELLTLTVELDDSSFNEKAESIEDKIEQIKKKSEDFRPGEDTANIPGYNQAINTKFDNWIDNLNHIVSTSKAIEKAPTAQDRDLLSASYKRQLEVAKNTVKDLMNSTAIAKDLTASIEESVSASFADGLKGVFEQLGTGLRTTATNISRTMGKLSDQEIVSRFMGSSSYQEIMKPVRTAHPGVFTDQRMEQYLTSQLPVYVPQSMRYAVTGGSSVVFPKKADSFRGLFPESFRNISVVPALPRKIGDIAGESTPLTQDEIYALQKIVETNRIAQDAAVRAGLYGKNEGGLYRNPNPTRGHINAMSGYVFRDAAVGAMGESKFGIQNPDDFEQWRKIERKVGNNNEFDSGRRAAHALHDAYGNWLNPGHYSNIQSFDPNQGTGIYTGPISMAPRRKTNAYAEYTLEMMNGNAQINGINPVVRDYRTGKWRTVLDVTGPTTKDNAHYGPSDFHTVTLAGSLENDILESTPGVTQHGQNEFNDNAIYLKYDPSWSNPTFKKKDREYAQTALAKRISEGYTANGHHYSFTRAGKTHAEFMRDDVIEALGRAELGLDTSEPGDKKVFDAGMKLLANGADLGEYDEYKAFAKSLYNQNNLATEGENLRTLWGVPFGFAENETTRRMLASSDVGPAMRNKIMREYGTPNVKVAVGSFGTDMDGANWGFTRLFNEGGQGRSYNGKATYVRVNLEELKKQYPGQIRENAKTAEEIAKLGNNITPEQKQNILNKYGSFLIPGAGAAGGDLLLDWDTDIVEDKKNIKNFSQTLEGLTQEQMNDRRSREVSRFGLSMKTTYGKANTSGRWLSRQLVNGPMNAGFSDPEVDAYFSKIFLDEMNRLSTDDQYIRRELFGGDQTVDLNSTESQNVIRGHLSSMIDSYMSGDRLLPHGVYSWNMAAPNPINVINNRLRAAGTTVPKAMQELELSDHDVISMGSLFDQLGIVRHPATVSGNIVAQNLARDKKMGPKIRKMSEQLGMDPKALYFKPDSPILQMLQGEDFDGDINGLFGLTGDAGPEFNKMMGRVFQISNDQNNAIWKVSGRTPEVQENIKSNVGKRETIGRRDNPFRLRSADDVALYIMEQARNTPLMGSADRTMDMMSMLLQNGEISPAVARAILDYESQYDIVSVHGKTGDEWNTTEDQQIARAHGRSFGNLFRWIGKSLQTVYDDEAGVEKQIWNGTSQQMFNARNIDALNFPTVSNGSLVGQLLAQQYSQAVGLPSGGLNPDGTPK